MCFMIGQSDYFGLVLQHSIENDTIRPFVIKYQSKNTWQYQADNRSGKSTMKNFVLPPFHG